MNINAIDLNLLPVLAALLEEVHVSRAAEQVGLSQPAMSHALNRLRDLLGDPVLVRHGRGMVLTPAALELREPVAELMSKIHTTLFEREPFDPQTWQGNIRVGCRDYSELVILSELAEILSQKGPGFQLNGIVGALDGPYEAIANGDMAFALGYFPDCPATFFCEDLAPERFVCIVSKDHPDIQEALSLDQFLRHKHVLIAPSGTPRGIVDETLEAQGLSRTIAVVVAHFMAAPAIVAKSHHICTLPERIALKAADWMNVKIFDPPLPVRGFSMQMVWNQRTHHDPPLNWIRQQIRDLTRSFKVTARS